MTVEATYSDGSRRIVWAPTAEAVARVVTQFGQFVSVTVVTNNQP